MTQTPRSNLRALQETLESADLSPIAAALSDADAQLGSNLNSVTLGQCWRLRWDETVLLAVITRVGPDFLLAMPLDVDPDVADETAVVVPGSPAGFAHGISVFAMLETGIGSWTLETLVGKLLDDDGVDALRRWMKHGDTNALPAEWQEGLLTPHNAHPRRQRELVLAETISAIGQSEWLADGWSRQQAPVDERRQPTPDQMRRALAQLGTSPNRISALLVTGAEPTVQERQQLTEVGLDGLIVTLQPPGAVLDELDQPRSKGAVLQLATRNGTTERDERQRLARAAMTLAARKAPGQDSGVSNAVILLREQIRRELDEE